MHFYAPPASPLVTSQSLYNRPSECPGKSEEIAGMVVLHPRKDLVERSYQQGLVNQVAGWKC